MIVVSSLQLNGASPALKGLSFQVKSCMPLSYTGNFRPGVDSWNGYGRAGYPCVQFLNYVLLYSVWGFITKFIEKMGFWGAVSSIPLVWAYITLYTLSSFAILHAPLEGVILNGENNSGNQKTVNLKILNPLCAIVEASSKYAQLLHLRKKIIQCEIGISMCNRIFRFRHEKTRRRSLWRNMSNMIIYTQKDANKGETHKCLITDLAIYTQFSFTIIHKNSTMSPKPLFTLI